MRYHALLKFPYPRGQIPAAEQMLATVAQVIKTDGERLHLRIPKDGRVREIALEMLRVIPLEPEGGVRRFKLERRI